MVRQEVYMSNLQGEIQSNLSQLMRTAATQYGHAVTQYGTAFAAYGRGEISAVSVAEATTRVLSNEARSIFDVGIGLASAYAKWSISLLGIKSLKEEVTIASDIAHEMTKPTARAHKKTRSKVAR